MRAEEGTGAGTCRSPGASSSLRFATPPARAAGIRPRRAAPRPPRRRRGERGGPPESVGPSRPAGARRLGAANRAGRGGTGRGRLLGRRPIGRASAAAWLLALRPRSPGGGPGAQTPAIAGCGTRAVRPADARKDRRPCGARAPAQARVQSHPRSRVPCPGGSRSAPSASYLRALRAGAATQRETDHLIPRPWRLRQLPLQKSRPKRHCTLAGILLGSAEAPTCFKTKCEEKNGPGPACLPAAPLPEDSCTVQNKTVSHAPFLDLPTKSHALSERGTSRVSFPKDGREVRGRCLWPRLRNKPGPQRGRRAVQKASRAPLQ